MTSASRIVFPALRWRPSTGFKHEFSRIEATLRLGVGGYILFGGRRADVRGLTLDLRAAAPHPLLIGSDLERGAGQQFDGLTHLPPPAALGFLNQPEITRTCGAITAREARAVGVNWVYGPVADLDLEPENPIVGTRSFGDDPARVSELVARWVEGAQAARVAASAKHFPGHGRTTADSHATLPGVATPLVQMETTDLEPFRAAVRAGVHSIMTAHVAYSSWDATGVPATMSRTILRHLRDQMAFTGLIVTDAFIMEGALRGRAPGLASVDAVAAGCDALLYPADAVAVSAALDKAGTVPAVRARIDEAAERVARLADLVPGSTAAPADMSEHATFAAATADLVVHVLRGEALRLVQPLAISIVDDDVGGPYVVGPRDVFARTLGAAGVGVGTGGARVTLIYAEPRSWKGRAALGARSLAALRRPADLYVLFGHPRLVAQLPGDAPVVCAWHGQPLMQEAAARWVIGRMK